MGPIVSSTCVTSYRDHIDTLNNNIRLFRQEVLTILSNNRALLGSFIQILIYRKFNLSN
jgi:hypothetical protein